jgi:hypothetical protein
MDLCTEFLVGILLDEETNMKLDFNEREFGKVNYKIFHESAQNISVHIKLQV